MQKSSVGNVLELYISTTKEPGREVKTEIYLDKGGIIGDKFHSKNIERSVLVSSTQSYDIVRNNSIEITAGALGENILLSYDPHNLKAGERLRIGEVILEVTQNCTVCKGLSAISPKLPKLLKGDRGIFTKVVEDGNIKIGDKIYIG